MSSTWTNQSSLRPLSDVLCGLRCISCKGKPFCNDCQKENLFMGCLWNIAYFTRLNKVKALASHPVAEICAPLSLLGLQPRLATCAAPCTFVRCLYWFAQESYFGECPSAQHPQCSPCTVLIDRALYGGGHLAHTLDRDKPGANSTGQMPHLCIDL